MVHIPRKTILPLVLLSLVVVSGACKPPAQPPATVSTPTVVAVPDAGPPTPKDPVRYVAVPYAFRSAEPRAGAAKLERLPSGTRLTVSAQVAGGYRKVLEGGRATGGYVPDADLEEKDTPWEALAQQARENLAALSLDTAAAFGERALARNPQDRDSALLLAAIYDANGSEEGARRIYRILNKLPVPPAVDGGVPTGTPAQDLGPCVVGELCYVAATRLRLREKPTASAPVLATLRLNTQVHVESIQDGFVGVAWTPETAGGSGDGGAQSLSGFLAAPFVSSTPTVRSVVQSHLERAQAQGDVAAQLDLLERLSMLPPVAASDLTRLARVAVDLKRYAVAAGAAVNAATVPSDAVVTVELARGCRGDRSKAVWLTKAEAMLAGSVRAYPNACLRVGDQDPPCPPCEPPEPCMLEACESATERKSAEREYKARMVEHRKEVQKQARELQAYETATQRLLSAFPDGPFMKITVQGAGAPGQSLFPWTVAASGGVCDAPGYQYDNPLVLPPMVFPGPGKSAGYWVKVLSVADTLHAVTTGTGEKEVRARVVGYRSTDLPPDPHAVGALSPCGCCGC